MLAQKEADKIGMACAGNCMVYVTVEYGNIHHTIPSPNKSMTQAHLYCCTDLKQCDGQH